jgi:phytoene dehydrogenase-like protein
LSDALAHYLRQLGGQLHSDAPVRELSALPEADAYLFDTAPEHLLAIAGQSLPDAYRRRLAALRRGPGVFKIDWALDGPIPWRDAQCARAGTVHLGGTLEEVAAGEASVARNEHPEQPFVLLSQPTMFDDTRAPAEHHTAWAYCHVPRGSSKDMTEPIERQVARFAPGFRDRILARNTINANDLAVHELNCVGGDITGGAPTLSQILAQPVLKPVPYATPNPRIWLCSSSTPPGAGVHGMCGYHAARAVLRRHR